MSRSLSWRSTSGSFRQGCYLLTKTTVFLEPMWMSLTTGSTTVVQSSRSCKSCDHLKSPAPWRSTGWPGRTSSSTTISEELSLWNLVLDDVIQDMRQAIHLLKEHQPDRPSSTTCGSGPLMLQGSDRLPRITIRGQENESKSQALRRTSQALSNQPNGELWVKDTTERSRRSDQGPAELVGGRLVIVLCWVIEPKYLLIFLAP